jgi:hypothetical protein
MFVDLWVFGIFAILFGVCAVWNRMRGITQGIEATLDKLETDKIIEIVNDEVIPYRRDLYKTARKRRKSA